MRQHIAPPSRPGFTLIEASISLFVLSIMIAIFGNFSYVRTLNRQTTLRSQAAALVDEEINALRRLGFIYLADQTNGPFRNVLYNAGQWNVVADGSAGHSAPNSLELARNSGITNALSGQLLWPAGAYDTATLQAKWKVATDSSATWSIGYVFHGRDASNRYRLQFASTGTDLDGGTSDAHNVWLEKSVGGVSTTVWGGVSTVNLTTNTWYTLRIVLAPTGSPTIKIYIDGNQQDPNNIADIDLTAGSAALAGWNGVHAYVDDAASTVNSVTSTWDFDSTTDLPAAWTRLSVNSVSDATPNIFNDNAQLTISGYPAAGSSLKQVTATVSWTYGRSTRSYTSTTFIGKSELGL